jgi:membrane protease YdiL (CAAX protease family)
VAALVARVVEGSWPDIRGLGEVNFLRDVGVVGALILWIATFGFGEETGWRGFALAHLQRRHSVATATMVVAVIWAVWHIPYWFYVPGYQDLGIAGAPGFFIALLLGSILMTWIYNSTGGSVVAVAVWHALFDVFSGSQATDGLMNGVMSTVVAL